MWTVHLNFNFHFSNGGLPNGKPPPPTSNNFVKATTSPPASIDIFDTHTNTVANSSNSGNANRQKEKDDLLKFGPDSPKYSKNTNGTDFFFDNFGQNQTQTHNNNHNKCQNKACKTLGNG